MGDIEFFMVEVVSTFPLQWLVLRNLGKSSPAWLGQN
jgi:hypothetical protein